MDASDQLSASLVKGLSILASFNHERRQQGIAELANHLEMKRSTVHRYVATLAALGYLKQDLATRKYRLGLRALDLGLAVTNSTDLIEVAQPHLQELSMTTGHTASLAVHDGIEIVYLVRRRHPHGIDMNLSIGSRLPVYCTSMGKALLAALPEAALQALLPRIPFEPRTPNTITSREALEAELDRIRQTGIAVNNEELTIGLRSVSCVVREPPGTAVAAINVAVHTANYSPEELVHKLGSFVQATANRISHDLGYRAPA